MKKGTFYIVAAPSGCGKSSVVNSLVAKIDTLQLSISYTTRDIRAGETDGKDYFFVSPTEFQNLKDNGALIESATVFGYEYGTSRYVVDKFLSNGQDVILDIDWQGARLIKELMPDCMSVYLLPPSRSELINRLIKRGRESIDIINARMDEVAEQVSHCSEFDYMIVNEDFERAVADFSSIIMGDAHKDRLSIQNQRDNCQNIIRQLLAER